MRQRWLCVHCPDFPIERFRIAERRRRAFDGPDDAGAEALVLVETGLRGVRITAADIAARRAGAFAGQALTDARAAAPHLRVEQADPEADTDALHRLGLWAMRYSPTVVTDGPGTLLIDIAGADHLHGGEAPLMADLAARLARIGFAARLGLAGTPAAARALARFGTGAAILPEGETAALHAFPVEALGLDRETVLLLHRLGLKRIGDVAALPRAALARRFASRLPESAVRLALDRLEGHVREALTPLQEPEPWRFTLPFSEPLIDATGIAMALDHLLAKAEGRLEREQSGGRGFTLHVFRADGGTSAVTVRLAEPARDRSRIARLFAPKLDEIDCGMGVDALVLVAHDPGPVAARQAGFVADEGSHFCDGLVPLIDILENRLGPGSVFLLAPHESHVPERAQRRHAPGAQATGQLAQDWRHWAEARPGAAPRPFRLFDRAEPVEVVAEVPDGPPVRFVWRRVARRVVRATGPERIAPEWWRAGAEGVAVRDYYAVEDEGGRRFWLYRAGLYGEADGTAPRWFLHGIFA